MWNDLNWIVSETAFAPGSQHHSETVFTIGNGYLGTRGALEEGFPGEERATLLHGVFDDIPIVFTELANAPDWTDLRLFLAGEPFRMDRGEVLEFSRRLDLRTGLLSRSLRWRSPEGRITRLKFERFASLANPHALLARVEVRPENYTGKIEARAALSGEVDTLGLKHWEILSQQTAPHSAWLRLCTRATRIELGAAFRLHVQSPAPVQHEGWDAPGVPTLVAATALRAGQTVVFEKTAVFFTSRDTGQPLSAANLALAGLPAPAWEALWPAHESAWRADWEACDVLIEGDDEAQLAMRFSIYSLLIAAPRRDERVNIGAKTLSGFGYRGHAFWDTEIFMLPLFIYTRPEIARNLLSYRYHTLPGARAKAAANGYRGAQYAWESAADGTEVTPTWVPHFADRTKMIRIWTGDIEIHISADVCYAILQYWRASGDDAFMRDRGVEIFVEVARFWASRAEWKAASGRYEFTDVIGPDEYHDHVDNNAFTNAIAVWQLQQAGQVLAWLESSFPEHAAQLKDRLALEPGETAQWAEVAAKIFYNADPRSGLVEQFDGYFQRGQVDLPALEPRTQSVQALLGIEGANEANILKQPDVLMLAYLLPERFDAQTLAVNYNYYTPRTDHTYGSSLGPSIQAILACKMGEVTEAYEHFMRAARADLPDVRGNAGDGIHGASAGGLWQAAVFGFGGLHPCDGGLCAEPRLPAHWKRLAFRIAWRGETLVFDLKP